MIDLAGCGAAITWIFLHLEEENNNSELTLIDPSQAKIYSCKACKMEWTQLEVMDHFRDPDFMCPNFFCGKPLHRIPDINDPQERRVRFNEQLRPFLDIIRPMRMELAQKHGE